MLDLVGNDEGREEGEGWGGGGIGRYTNTQARKQWYVYIPQHKQVRESARDV